MHWWGRGDSNSHAQGHMILNPAIPVCSCLSLDAVVD